MVSLIMFVSENVNISKMFNNRDIFEDIISKNITALNTIYKDCVFSYSENESKLGLDIPIIYENENFGFIHIKGIKYLNESQLLEVKSAVKVLAVTLDNELKTQLLKD